MKTENSRRYKCTRCGAKGRHSKSGRNDPPICPRCIAEQCASDNADWFDSLVKDVAEILGCESKPTVILESAKIHAECVWLLKNVGELYPVTDATAAALAKLAAVPSNDKLSHGGGNEQ